MIYNVDYCKFVEIYYKIAHYNGNSLKKRIHNLSDLLNDFCFEKLDEINNQFIEISKIINIKNYNLNFYTNRRYGFIFSKNYWTVIDNEIEEELYYISIKKSKIRLSNSKEFVSFNSIINFA